MYKSICAFEDLYCNLVLLFSDCLSISDVLELSPFGLALTTQAPCSTDVYIKTITQQNHTYYGQHHSIASASIRGYRYSVVLLQSLDLLACFILHILLLGH